MLQNAIVFGFICISWLFLGGCSSSTIQENNLINLCKTQIMPKWTKNDFVGVSRITASSSKSEQKQIALQRAIALLVMTKGHSEGDSFISLQKELKSFNKKELYLKSFKENSSIKLMFRKMEYNIKIENMWQDECTKEIYVSIKEK